MLLDVRHDRAFQAFLDREEQRLYTRIWPPLAATIRMQMSRGGVAAQGWLIKRAEPILLAHYRRVYGDIFDSVRAKIEKAAPRRGEFIRRQLAWLESEAGTRIHGISQNLIDDVSAAVFAGVSEGKPHAAIARDIEERIPSFANARAATIARTETHSAATGAMDATIRDMEIEIAEKEWWTAGDDRVRESHAAVHGERVPMDEPFEVGGDQMMFPGDDSLGADAGEIIGCRCSCLYHTAD